MFRQFWVLNVLIVCNLMPMFIANDSFCPSNSNDVSKVLGFIDWIGNLLQEAKNVRTKCHCSANEQSSCPDRPVDCYDIFQCGETKSGKYTIWPRSRIIATNVQVYCDMDTDGGGWTVFQRRGDFGHPADYFYNDWQTYKQGFGNIGQDFWIGNDLLFGITNQRLYTLRVDMKDLENQSRFAVYNHFWINGEEYNYKIHVRGYSGTAGDAFAVHHGRMFSTKDRKNDENANENCAQVYKGAWWYYPCHHSNLNGLYLKGNHTTFADGVNWKQWKGFHYSLPFTEMKIRPFLNAVPTENPN